MRITALIAFYSAFSFLPGCGPNFPCGMPAKILSQWVYAPWFLTVVGMCETLGAIGLPILALRACPAGLCGIMIGAVYTLVRLHRLKELPFPIVVFILLMLVIFLRRKEAGALPA